MEEQENVTVTSNVPNNIGYFQTYYPNNSEFESTRLKEKAVEQTVLYFKDKDGVTEKTFMNHLEKIYKFLLTGETTTNFLTKQQ